MDAMESFLVEQGGDVVWETYHENSKTSRAEPHVYFDRYPSDQTVVEMMRSLRDVKPYLDRPAVPLPDALPPAERSLDEALLARRSARAFGEGGVSTAALAKVLRCAYGVTEDNADTDYPRPFRAVPSGGALYPLELYVWARAVDGLPAGLYHYDPADHQLDALGGVDLHGAFVQPDLVAQAAAVVLVSAVFFRSVFKYGERGYRFVLLEAGHVVQNAVLAALGGGLATVPLGGYFDREVDRALGLDGLNESVVYGFLLGRPAAS